MIIWNSGGDLVNLGTVEEKHCQVCEKDQSFGLILQYRYWGLYWIFNFVTKKQYTLVCDVCQRGWTLDKSEVEDNLDAVPIPFMRRFGLLVLIAVVGGFVTLTALGSV